MQHGQFSACCKLNWSYWYPHGNKDTSVAGNKDTSVAGNKDTAVAGNKDTSVAGNKDTSVAEYAIASGFSLLDHGFKSYLTYILTS